MHIKTSNQEKMHLGFGNYTCNWGTHFCGLYETKAERDDIMFGFLHQGDIEGDLQLYCPMSQTISEISDSYHQKFSENTSHFHDEHFFNFVAAKDLYYPSGTFSPYDMDEGLNGYYQKSQQNGRRNVRAAAEMIWAKEAIPGVEHLMVYESRLNYFIPGKPWISICLYDLCEFSGAEIMKVLQTHPFVISNGAITSNPYYQDPDEWLRENAPEFSKK